MALVSPGIQISVTDQSQYVNANVGSVPLVVLATAQDKTHNGSPATGTSKANAGKLLAFSSQRDLVTRMGSPSFQVSAYGTPVNGSEVNEYGLLAAYSALGLSNQLFAIRADIDLAQLTGTANRPEGAPDNGTLWLDTANTQWGIYVWNSVTSKYTNVTPLIITDYSQVESIDYTNPSTENVIAIDTPKSVIGQVGQYALVFVTADGNTASTVRLFYKAGADSTTGGELNNSWVAIGSEDWCNAVPAVLSTPTGTIQNGSTFSINSSGTITVSGTGLDALVSAINGAHVTGVSASNVNGKLAIFVTSAAANSRATLHDLDANKVFEAAGIPSAYATGTKSYYSPYVQYSTYSSAPAWATTDTTPRPSGSIWWKTSATGGGYSPVFKTYNSTSASWVSTALPLFSGIAPTIYALDPVGGGVNIVSATAAEFNVVDDTPNNFRIVQKVAGGMASGTGGAPTPTNFAIGDTVTISSTIPGSSSYPTTTVTLSGTSVESFVSDILSANIPNVVASLNSNGTVTITHTANGSITLANGSSNTNDPITGAGFVNGQGSGFKVNAVTGQVSITAVNNVSSSVMYQSSAPAMSPADGTLWYYSSPEDVDIMINTSTGWKGYYVAGTDSRGYPLNLTDPNGVIVTATTAPVTQSDGVTPVKPGDLWLDSGDLVNYPSLYRYTGSAWAMIDNTDHVSSDGIIFADARWGTSGSVNPIDDALPSIATLGSSDYTDLDCPDYRLYPRGTLLFNTRRSGYNIKRFVRNYFNVASFPNGVLPSQTDAWVTASGLDENGVVNAGTKAQRALVVDAMEAALSSNSDVLSSVYNFNLVCAPGYPELIPAMATLNNNRGNTAFVIGDSPLDLAPNSTDLINYFDNTMGGGLPQVASPYLGVYYPAGLTNDLAGNQVVVPASHAALRTFLYNDQVAYPWFAPAGTKRGLVDNLSDIGYIDSATGGFVHNGINQGLRDSLFTLNVNPITQLPGTGLVVYAQQTRSGTSSAQSRINVARLENYLRTIFASISTGYLFEPNDQLTRKSIARQIESALNNVLSLRGLYDYLVVCDTSNNTPYTIANDQLYVDVAIEPTRDVEFIYIPIAIYNPGGIAAIGTSST